MNIHDVRHTAESQAFTDVPCTVCGCVCDDLRVTVRDDRIVAAERACHLAEPWFAALASAPAARVATIGGAKASLEHAITRAAEILSRSCAPLVWGLTRSSTAGQRAAVQLAESIGGTVDTAASASDGATVEAFQEVGESTCTLGEVRNRADLVIFWGADPVVSHPRHLERYSGDARGLFVPRGRADRTLVVIDSQPTATSAQADIFIQVPRGADFDVVRAMRQLLRGIEPTYTDDFEVPLVPLRQLVARMKSCHYGALFFGLGSGSSASDRADVEALLQLVAELNRFTRFTARRLGADGGLGGAESVLCWLTGYPMAVNFARGFPRYGPREYVAAQLLERGEVDACVLVGSESCTALSEAAQHNLRQLPTIALDYPNARSPWQATVQITTAIYGVHAAGTAYRMDGVPLPLRQLLPAPYPTDDDALNAIMARLRR